MQDDENQVQDDQGQGKEEEKEPGQAKKQEPESRAISRLQQQKAETTLRLEVAENLKKLLDLGLATDRLSSGSAEIGGDSPPIESVLLAYQSLNELVRQIAAKIKVRDKEKVITRIRISDASDSKRLADFAAFDLRLQWMEKEIDAATADAKAALETAATLLSIVSLSVAGAILSSTLQLAGLFRTDRKLTYSKIDVQQQALVVAMAGALVGQKIETSYGALLPELPVPGSGADTLATRLQRLGDKRSALSTTLAVLEADLTHPADDAADLKVEARKAAVTATVAQATAALTRFDAFEDTLNQIDATTRTSNLAEMLLAERLTALFAMPCHVLILEVLAGGGASQTTKRAFSTSLTFSGGAVVSFSLFEAGGRLLDAGILSFHSGFADVDTSNGGAKLALGG